MRTRLWLAGLLPAMLMMTGCHHHTKMAHNAPPDERPDWSSGYVRKHPAPASTGRAETAARTEKPRAAIPHAPVGEANEDNLHGKPVLVETGMASWYGTEYNHRKAADGTVYEKNDMTAAHRTLPLGSLARVTNLATGESVVVRITDRGPFVRGRVLDLSEGAARQIDLYRMGVAKVKVEAYAPQVASASSVNGGMWCVQTGAFDTERDAMDLRNALAKRYATAKVQEFQGPTGFWVRIDPAGRSHQQAMSIQDWIGKPDDHADAYLVRLD